MKSPLKLHYRLETRENDGIYQKATERLPHSMSTGITPRLYLTEQGGKKRRKKKKTTMQQKLTVRSQTHK